MDRLMARPSPGQVGRQRNELPRFCGRGRGERELWRDRHLRVNLEGEGCPVGPRHPTRRGDGPASGPVDGRDDR